MPAPRRIRWLHLSDLHLGCRGEELWWQVHEELEASIREKTRELGAPDLILFTGDLTYSGKPEQFEQVDVFLDELLGWIREEAPGAEPLLVSVPGNHDLQRPKRAHRYQALDAYHDADSAGRADLDQELWEDGDASFIEPLFSGYREWFERRVLPDLEKRTRLTLSHFPGDFSCELDLGGFALAVVGVNSTWQQYTGGDFRRRLVIPSQQFQAALPTGGGESPLAILQRCSRTLLLMHHPPSWLAPRGRKFFDESIYPPGRFDVCLYGHMHQGRSVETSLRGGPPRCFFQSPSLFGLEHYGSSQEERAIGYSWGELSAEGVVRVWPLRRAQPGGRGEFVHDADFPAEPDGTIIGGWERKVPEPVARPADLSDYLRDLIDQTDHIRISGIGASRARGAHRYPIESLYTPLSSRGVLEEQGEAPMLRAERSVALAELLPRQDRLLIEGQPGAGKTTFLRLVACMLARDLAGEPCPGGATWRSRYLGLPADEEARVPVLLRVSELVSLLLDPKAPGHRKDNRLWLLDLLDRMCEDNEHEVSREHWKRLLEEGGAVLLLDGLDEAADEKLRARIFEIFRDACKKWSCPVVVTSRPLQTAPLREMGFHHASIEPFGDQEIRTFLDHWVTALHTTEGGTPGREARRYEEALSEAILSRPRVRRLATNPVMLTSLCVVHWNEGQRLPEGRSRVYAAVIGWLLAARSEQRREAGFSDLFAERALARLALSMMGDLEKSKRVVVDLAPGAEAVMALLEREMPDSGPEDRRLAARRWLEFECLGSGIVEELPGRRIRFWHLTFQEFLAARQLAWMSDGEEGNTGEGGGAWWPHLRAHLDSAQWRETVELFPGTLLDGGVEGVDLLLERVLELRGSRTDLATDAQIAGILGRLLRPLEVLEYRASREIQRSFDELLERSLAIFEVEGAGQVPIEDRVEAAEALGRGGDPRLDAGRDTHLLEVAGLGGVRLGKYAVTVQEYQRFVEEVRGYEERRFWSEEGWEAKVEGEWTEPGSWPEQLDHPNRPVVEVSWYEAQSYCRWLSELWGVEVRLPTQEEWETAATSPEGEYPWGGAEPDSERANFGRKVGHPTPVGLYPAGNGPYGHCDLAGNVWEWCSDEEEVAWAKEEGGRALRGGGWSSPAVFLRSAFRVGCDASDPSRRRPRLPPCRRFREHVGVLIFVDLLGSRGGAPGRWRGACLPEVSRSLTDLGDWKTQS